MTPLHWAVENGHTNVVNLLLKNNAATHLVDKVCLLLLEYKSEALRRFLMMERLGMSSGNKFTRHGLCQTADDWGQNIYPQFSLVKTEE